LGQSDGQGGVVNIQDASAGFVTGKTIHVDEHVIVFVPYDGKVYRGGGAFLDKGSACVKWVDCSIVTAIMPMQRSRDDKTLT